MTLKNLPKEVLNKIQEYHCPTVHPTAQMIKQLVFFRDEEGIRMHGCPALYVYGRDSNPKFRRYLFTDFAEPDRYIEDSNRDSGFILGQVRNDRQELIRRIIAFYDDFTYTVAGILDRPLS